VSERCESSTSWSSTPYVLYMATGSSVWRGGRNIRGAFAVSSFAFEERELVYQKMALLVLQCSDCTFCPSLFSVGYGGISDWADGGISGTSAGVAISEVYIGVSDNKAKVMSVYDCVLHVCRWFVVCLVFWLISEREIIAATDGLVEVVAGLGGDDSLSLHKRHTVLRFDLLDLFF